MRGGLYADPLSSDSCKLEPGVSGQHGEGQVQLSVHYSTMLGINATTDNDWNWPPLGPQPKLQQQRCQQNGRSRTAATRSQDHRTPPALSKAVPLRARSHCVTAIPAPCTSGWASARPKRERPQPSSPRELVRTWTSASPRATMLMRLRRGTSPATSRSSPRHLGPLVIVIASTLAGPKGCRERSCTDSKKEHFRPPTPVCQPHPAYSRAYDLTTGSAKLHTHARAHTHTHTHTHPATLWITYKNNVDGAK